MRKVISYLFLLNPIVSYAQHPDPIAFDSLFKWVWNHPEAVIGRKWENAEYRQLKSKKMLASKHYYDKRKRRLKDISVFAPTCYPSFLITFTPKGDTCRIFDLSSNTVLLHGPPMPFMDYFLHAKELCDSLVNGSFSDEFVKAHIRFNVRTSYAYINRKDPKAILSLNDSYFFYDELPDIPDDYLIQYDFVFNDSLAINYCLRFSLNKSFAFKETCNYRYKNTTYPFEIDFNKAVGLAANGGFQVLAQSDKALPWEISISHFRNDFYWEFSKITSRNSLGLPLGTVIFINARTGEMAILPMERCEPFMLGK